MAILSIRGREHTAKIVNESAGGFAVAVDELLTLRSGNEVWLFTHNGWNRARVVHISQLGLASFIGLERLEGKGHPSPGARPDLDQLYVRSISGRSRGILAGLGCVVCLAALVYMTPSGNNLLSWARLGHSRGSPSTMAVSSSARPAVAEFSALVTRTPELQATILLFRDLATGRVDRLWASLLDLLRWLWVPPSEPPPSKPVRG